MKKLILSRLYLILGFMFTVVMLTLFTTNVAKAADHMIDDFESYTSVSQMNSEGLWECYYWDLASGNGILHLQRIMNIITVGPSY